jgi:hypothetical protein
MPETISGMRKLDRHTPIVSFVEKIVRICNSAGAIIFVDFRLEQQLEKVVYDDAAISKCRDFASLQELPVILEVAGWSCLGVAQFGVDDVVQLVEERRQLRMMR